MMLQEGGVKIWRPRQVKCRSDYPSVLRLTCTLLKIYVGSGKKDYVPLDERVAEEDPRKTPSVVVHSG